MRRLVIAILAVAALAPACGKKKGAHPAPAGKPISPPAVEPLPAPRSSGQLPSPAGTPTETSPAVDAGAKAKR
jgi:hypothetical protein